MANRVPHPLQQLIDEARRGTQIFLDFLASLNTDDTCTLATLPPPLVGRRVIVTDATGGPVPCYGDGTNFRRYSDDAIVS